MDFILRFGVIVMNKSGFHALYHGRTVLVAIMASAAVAEAFRLCGKWRDFTPLLYLGSTIGKSEKSIFEHEDPSLVDRYP